MKRWVRRGATALCLLMVTLTALALVNTDEWWIRVLDFPRPQIAAVLGAGLLVLWGTSRGTRFPALTSIAAATALLCQVSLIVPYTPFWTEQMVAARRCADHHGVRFLLANVLQENRNADPLLALAPPSTRTSCCLPRSTPGGRRRCPPWRTVTPRPW